MEKNQLLQGMNNSVAAIVEVARAQDGKDPLRGTGMNPDGSFETGPLEETEGAR